MITRKCKVCNEIKEIDQFNHGRHTCKVCRNAYQQKLRSRPDLYAKKLAKGREYARTHKEENLRRGREWVIKQREKNLSGWLNKRAGYARKLYRESPIERERQKAYSRKYRKLHPEEVRNIIKRSVEKYRQYHPDWKIIQKAYNRSYLEQHPEAIARMHEKRAERLNAKPSDVTIKDIRLLSKKARLFGVCPLCGCVPRMWELEHAIPLKRGGAHTKDNIYYCCSVCNRAKRTQTLEEFAGIKFSELPVKL